MEISLISDTLTTIATKYHGLGFSNFLTDRRCSSHDQHLQIYALMVPIDAVAPPLVKPRTAPKKLARKRCRIKRSSKTDGGEGGAGAGEDGGGFFDGGDGPFGGAGGDSGAGGGNYDGFNWDESLPASPSDPAFDFVYEVLCWIVLSNCLHFAFKKVVRILGDGVADPGREKVPMRFTPIC